MVPIPLETTAAPHSAAWERSRTLRASGSPAEAVKILRQALTTESRDYRIHDELGMALVDLDRQEEAIGSFINAFILKPDFDEACYKIGVAFAAHGLHEPAAEWFFRARTMNPAETRYLYLHGRTLAALQQHQQAAEVFDQWISVMPGKSIARHLVEAALDSRVVTKAPADYVRTLFDDFAGRFDDTLGKLNYCGPDLVRRALLQVGAPPASGWDIFDAGCGTGLSGIALKPLARRLVGVDLSAGMLNVARQHAIYDELIQDDIIDYLRRHTLKFDVVTATDVLTYFGDLNDFFLQAAVALRPAGRVVVAVEALNTGLDYRLNPSGRFSHGQHYLRHVMTMSGFEVAYFSDDVMRHELNRAVPTWVAVGAIPKA